MHFNNAGAVIEPLGISPAFPHVRPQEQGHLAAELSGRLLKGASPDHPTLLSPRLIDLIFKMRIAKAMSLTPYFPVLGSAARIIM